MLIGPFKQLLSMNLLPKGGRIDDDQLPILPDAGMRILDGQIVEIGSFGAMQKTYKNVQEVPPNTVALPGFIDAHTHLCFAGNRARDYAYRVSGVSYQEIAQRGGGILDTVRETRSASKDELVSALKVRASKLLKSGITTCEVKSGYGLSVREEIKLLEAIQEVSSQQPVSLIPTCLAAHTRPPEFANNADYLQAITSTLFPVLKKKNLAHRIDIFVDAHAFSPSEARGYLNEAKAEGFSICLHADQFDNQGSLLAAELNALSADHLENTTCEAAKAMRAAGVIPIVLPGATLGLGMRFPPARMLLDEGLPLVIASDWNPGSAPMGDLLAQAALLGAAEHLTMAETLSALTDRAARALSLSDRGMLAPQKLADICVFPCSDYREILYYQGQLKPLYVYKKGIRYG